MKPFTFYIECQGSGLWSVWVEYTPAAGKNAGKRVEDRRLNRVTFTEALAWLKRHGPSDATDPNEEE